MKTSKLIALITTALFGAGIAKAQFPDTTKLEPLNNISINGTTFVSNNYVRMFENENKIPNTPNYVIYVKDKEKLNEEQKKLLNNPPLSVTSNYIKFFYEADKNNQKEKK